MAGPLAGIRIVDLSRLAPGPYATMLLGDMGADIVKIEEVGPPSGRRASQRPSAGSPFESDARGHAFNALNRNKKSLRLNLKTEEGRAIFYRLAREADVLVEEFRPDVKTRLGIDYPTISALNPRIVYCSVTGYGQTGPYRDLVGHDLNYLAHAGLLGQIGRPESGPAIPLNVVADFAGGGLQAALAIMFALFARERSGHGQYVDCAMHDGVISLLAAAFADFFRTGRSPGLGETWLQGAAPFYQVYPCADGKWLSIGALEPYFFANLCRLLGLGAFADEQWNVERWPAMRAALSQIFQTKSRDDWFALLSQSDVGVARVFTLDEVPTDPQVQARQMIVDVADVRFGAIRQIGIIPKLSETPGAIRSNPPRPGEHTDEILRALGYGDEEIQRWREAGIVA
jgi:crotonobetainyl-CoA:carnitine CoA-transferase CaiB-like acyl-CoA transferase